jgi:REP element-mobilizing transposase RayT
MIDRHYLITWTCYGQWLPGDRRGFVGNFRLDDGTRISLNEHDTPYAPGQPDLENWTRLRMKGEPVALDRPEASAMIEQFQETARIRNWLLEAASVMFNHAHLVVGVPGDPEPDRVRETFKSWATRAVKRLRPVPPNGTFWTAKGSNPKLPDAAAVRAAVVYVARKQPNPLATVWAPHWRKLFEEYDRQVANAR